MLATIVVAKNRFEFANCDSAAEKVGLAYARAVFRFFLFFLPSFFLSFSHDSALTLRVRRAERMTKPQVTESQPWSNISPKGVELPVRRACLPSMASRV